MTSENGLSDLQPSPKPHLETLNSKQVAQENISHVLTIPKEADVTY